MVLHRSGPVDYEAVLADLEAKLAAGQAQFEAWQAARDELVSAISSIKSVISREGQKQMYLPFPGGDPQQPTSSNVGPGFFRGLSYRLATRKYFELAGKPLSAPEVADALFRSGYAKNRRIIKGNVDSIFKKLREEKFIQKVGGSTSYEMVSMNGDHPPQPQPTF